MKFHHTELSVDLKDTRQLVYWFPLPAIGLACMKQKTINQ